MLNKYTAAAVVAGSMLVGGALGVAVFAPHLAGASSTPTPAVSQSTPAPSASNGNTFQSNEDQAHEANESPQREADENSGKAFRGDHGHGRGFGHGGSNEDPAHEASESPQREAQENEAGNGSQAPASVPAPSSPLS
jgi:hypothetical protein